MDVHPPEFDGAMTPIHSADDVATRLRALAPVGPLPHGVDDSVRSQLETAARKAQRSITFPEPPPAIEPSIEVDSQRFTEEWHLPAVEETAVVEQPQPAPVEEPAQKSSSTRPLLIAAVIALLVVGVIWAFSALRSDSEPKADPANPQNNTADWLPEPGAYLSNVVLNGQDKDAIPGLIGEALSSKPVRVGPKSPGIGPMGPMVNGEKAQSCAMGLTLDPTNKLVVIFVSYQDKAVSPAAVVAVPNSKGGATAYVTGRNCSKKDTKTIAGPYEVEKP